MEKNENVYTLIIKEVVRKDAAQYTIKATNSVGTANGSATLKVNGMAKLFNLFNFVSISLQLCVSKLFRTPSDKQK